MNTDPKLVLVALLFALLGCASCQATPLPISEQQCHEARLGMLEVSTLESLRPAENSYLLTCVLAPVVLESNATANEAEAVKQSKIQLANRILRTELDPAYTNEHGMNLVMAVVIATYPESWKLKTIEQLVSLGAKPNITNEYGKTTFELAQANGGERLAQLIRELEN